MNRSEMCRRNYERHRRRKGFFGRLVGTLIKGGLVMLIWNLLVPGMGGPVIGFGQAILLVILGHLLSGGFWRAKERRRKWRAHFEAKMREKMEGMSPEEKEKFKKGFTSGKWEVNVVEVEEEKEESEGSEETEEEEGEDGEEK